MGCVKGRHLKVLAKKLVDKNPGVFTERFADDKLKLKEFRILEDSREEQNKLAGEIANLVKRSKRPRDEMRPRPQRDWDRGERGGYGGYGDRGERGGRGFGDRGGRGRDY